MDSLEMKKAKFDFMVRDLDMNFGRTGLGGVNPVELFAKNSKDNPWVNSIIKNSFLQRGVGVIGADTCMTLRSSEDYELNRFIENCRRCDECTKMHCYPNKCNIKFHLMFWLVFVVAVDKDHYKENLGIVADAAYLLKFTDEMLRDWMNAVKSALANEPVYEQEYISNEAKNFFY